MKNPLGKQFNNKLRKALGFLIGVALLIWLLSEIDPNMLVSLLRQLDLKWFALGCLAYIVTMWTRAYRFIRLTKSSMRHFQNMSLVVFATSLAKQILPVRLGDLSYVFLAKRNQNLLIGKGVASLLIALLFDLLAVSILCLVGIGLMFKKLPSESNNYMIAATVLMVLIAVSILILVTWRNFICTGCVKVIQGQPMIRGTSKNRLIGFVKDVEEGLNLHGGSILYLDLLVSSILVWLFSFVIFYILLRGLNISVTVGQTLIGGTFAAFTSILPINAIGNFGTLEAGWTIGFVFSGMRRDLAITTGLAVHLLYLVYAIFFGLIAWGLILFPTRRSPKVSYHDKSIISSNKNINQD